MFALFGVLLFSTPFSVHAVTTEIKDCKSSWACFKDASKHVHQPK